MTSMLRTVALSLAVAVSLAACGQDQPRGDPLTGGPPTRPLLPAGHPPVDQLPPGHPPVSDAGTPPPAKGSAPAAAASGAPFTWTVPSGWKETAGTGMRLAQFELPAKQPDGSAVQAVLFTLMGGGVDSNIERWRGQVKGDGTGDVTTFDANGMKITRLEKRGAYAGMGGSGTDVVFLGAVIDVGQGDQVYTVRLFGPAAAIDAEKANFDAFLTSLKRK